MSRRAVLGWLGGLGVAAAVGGGAVEVLRRRGGEGPGESGGPEGTGLGAAPATAVLVLVTLYGGNDGLNTLVPYADPAYRAARGDLAIGPDQVLALDDQLGLNPGLTGFKALWDAGHLAVVRGVGYPEPNRSHFRSMDIWQSGVPDRVEPTGWLGRWLDTTERDPMRALAVGTNLPLALRGAHGTGGVVPTARFTLPANAKLDAAFRAMAASAPTSTPTGSLAAELAAANRDLLTIQEQVAAFEAADQAGATPGSSLDGGPAAGTNPLADQLAVVAKAVRNGSPTQVYSVSLGGFDTHATERERHVELLRNLGDGVNGFLGHLGPQAAKVVVLVHSEFGRRVAVNASNGTDHGTAAPVFLAGPGVKGGFHGDEPSLTDLDQGDLKVTTDFRSVYAAVLASVLTTDPARILPNGPPPLPLL